MSPQKKRILLLIAIVALVVLVPWIKARIDQSHQTADANAPALSAVADDPAEAEANADDAPIDDGDGLLTLLPDGGDGALDDDAPDDANAPSAAEDAAEAPPDGEPDADASANAEKTPAPIDEHGAYTTRDDVALYLYTYGRLPENFLTKDEAEGYGWSGGGLDDYAYGMCIGGDRFGNHEGILPEKKGRKYYECDIDTLHRNSRGAKRIVFSNDGLIYYSGDHYDSFTLLYGE